MEDSSLLTIEVTEKILNLGSGNKKIEGATNVDMSPETNPDIVSDVPTFVANEAAETWDEVHMYHVLEHFDKHTAMQLLIDIHRILKPGGAVIIECPDIMKCAINILQAKVNGDKLRIERFGLLGFYGDPEEPGPGMLHKWGYWPEYMMNIFEEIGFSSGQIETPVSKTFAQLERDFRVVGIK
jgi:SAM-dependent methyltransferase